MLNLIHAKLDLSWIANSTLLYFRTYILVRIYILQNLAQRNSRDGFSILGKPRGTVKLTERREEKIFEHGMKLQDADAEAGQTVK